MIYVSTRDRSRQANAAQAVVQGISREGGLFAPLEIPSVSLAEIAAMTGMSYPERAAFILTPWLECFSGETVLRICRDAYTRFDTPAIAPVACLSGRRSVLELWHGPTLAFKDMALQLLPLLMSESARLTGETRDILILVATSGDTGKAALEGFRDRPGVKICVFYPENGVSEAQRLQMVTQEGGNVRAVAVKGNFDDAQTGVKQIFTDPARQKELAGYNAVFSSANSINLGRLLPQIAYYFSAYCDMISQGQAAIGDPFNITVPTGNFGNILAAHYAARMGLPVHRLICASNSNNVLSDFIRTGIYDRNRAFHLTTSPSMDILISSNLERLLFELADCDDSRVRELMDELKSTGRYALSDGERQKMQRLLWGGWANEEQVLSCIGDTFRQDRYLIDPHTAVAFCCADAYRRETGDGLPMLIASTASPFKFGRSVLRAIEDVPDAMDDFDCDERLSQLSGRALPDAIALLRKKPVLHTAVAEKDALWQAVLPLVKG